MARGSQKQRAIKKASGWKPRRGQTPSSPTFLEGVWSDGEGPGLLAGILWFPPWHLFLSVLWVLLHLPALASFPVKEEGAKSSYVWGSRGKKRCYWQCAKWCWLSVEGGAVGDGHQKTATLIFSLLRTDKAALLRSLPLSGPQSPQH